MENIETLLQRLFFCSISVIFIFEAIILFLRTNGNKARRTLAWVIFIWGATYFIRLVNVCLPNDTFTESYSLFRVNIMVVGNFYLTLLYLFPLQVLVPGWLNWKRLLLLYAPVIAIAAFYFIVLKILGETPMHLMTYQEIWDNFGHFNVWYRIILFSTSLFYIYVIISWLCRYESRYNKWKNDNFANQEYMDISWMKAYIVVVALTFVAYVFGLAYGTQLPVLIHSVVVITAFTYIFYKGLFYESPYPEDFFSRNATHEEPESEPLEIIIPQNYVENISEKSFESRIPNYIKSLKTWLDNEKPYLYTDFKLTDVTRILPLNRSYLSRVFNEGFGHNFNEVIGSYRVEYSKRVIEKEPMLSLHKVAKLSGFNSDSTFIRVFKQKTGISPSQYKEQQKDKIGMEEE